MRFSYDHDYHIHSQLSLCSKDEGQTNERILSYAKENGLHTVCLTNHYWDKAVETTHGFYIPQDFEHLQKALPLPKDDEVRFVFGCEAEMLFDGTLSIPKSRFDDFEWILIPLTHMQWHGFTISAEDAVTAQGRAKAWVEKLDLLLQKDLPFRKVGLAHLVNNAICRNDRAGYIQTLREIPETEMVRLFEKVARLGCGVELNSYDMRFTDEEERDVLRPFRIAKECGCKFYLGSDVHFPNVFAEVTAIFERAIDRLGLTEEDKFRLV